jgi:hypothetical protein
VRWVTSLVLEERQLTDILRVLLLKAKATEMIPGVDKDVSVNHDRGVGQFCVGDE